MRVDSEFLKLESGSEFGGFFFLGELVGIACYTSRDCSAAGIASARIIVRQGWGTDTERDRERDDHISQALLAFNCQPKLHFASIQY
jgi:hypothetical protein